MAVQLSKLSFSQTSHWLRYLEALISAHPPSWLCSLLFTLVISRMRSAELLEVLAEGHRLMFRKPLSTSSALYPSVEESLVREVVCYCPGGSNFSSCRCPVSFSPQWPCWPLFCLTFLFPFVGEWSPPLFHQLVFCLPHPLTKGEIFWVFSIPESTQVNIINTQVSTTQLC